MQLWISLSKGEVENIGVSYEGRLVSGAESNIGDTAFEFIQMYEVSSDRSITTVHEIKHTLQPGM
ncbi:MAG: hypothetical protein ACE5NG_09920 [bacterium]